MKIRFESDNDLPLGKALNLPNMIIVIISVFYLNVCMIFKKCYNMKELIFLKELTLIKQVHQKSV